MFKRGHQNEGGHDKEQTPGKVGEKPELTFLKGQSKREERVKATWAYQAPNREGKNKYLLAGAKPREKKD